jgi:hypothetical protein
MSFFLYFVQLVALLAVFYKTKRSVLEPTLWTDPNPLPSFDGPLTANDLLSDVNTIDIKGDFAGPESIAFHTNDGIAYASFNDGTVGSFSSGRLPFPVKDRVLFFSGAFVAGINDSSSKEHQELVQWCQNEVKEERIPWVVTSEKKCGRPLGLRVRDVSRCPFFSSFFWSTPL